MRNAPADDFAKQSCREGPTRGDYEQGPSCLVEPRRIELLTS